MECMYIETCGPNNDKIDLYAEVCNYIWLVIMNNINRDLVRSNSSKHTNLAQLHLIYDINISVNSNQYRLLTIWCLQ